MKHEMKMKPTQNLILTGIFFFIASCGHEPMLQDFPDTASPAAEIEKLNADINTAEGLQVNVLSPSNFKNASEALMEAKKDLDRQKDSKDILHQVAIGRAYLTRANEAALLSHTNMEEVINARANAIAANAPSLVSKEFNQADNDLRDVTSDLETNDIRSAQKNKSKLQAQYLDLEVQAIKRTNLEGPRKTIEQAIKEGAKDFAPRTLAIAKKSVDDTDAFITANRHDTAQITERANQAKNNADHLLTITVAAKATKKTSPEDVALQMETEKSKVAEGQDQLRSEQSATANLRKEEKGLESEKKFNQLFDDAHALFNEDEAQVYKEGKTLVIRLKGLEFPTNQATLRGSSFELLGKVQRVIEDFGPSAITVEGHTDSVGGKDLNKKLSTERAQAVKEYLASNSKNAPLDIKSIGMDFQKPLASNKTAKGRAQNRRVDILIEPE